MATLEEDFTFPTTTTTSSSGSPPRFIDSPPLWRRSPPPTTGREKPEKLKGKQVEDDEEKFKSWSFQELKKDRSVDKKSNNFYEEGEEEEEKMDVLWENLNDDQNSRSCVNKMGENCDVFSPERGVQIRCAKSLKLSKANGQMFSGKKPIILVFIKVVKKVFLMQNSHRRIKKQAW